MNAVKYPRTPHLPWSNPTDDDRVIESLSGFEGEEIIVTPKLDGENTTMTSSRFYARSLEEATGVLRERVKGVWHSVAHEIPEGWRICGENMQWKHSIHYRHLSSWFYVFGIWDSLNYSLSWDNTLEWCDIFGLTPVPRLYRGPWDENIVKSLPQPEYNGDLMEGIVVRVARSFRQEEFDSVVAKWVRPNHVSSDRHWRYAPLTENVLEGD